MAPRMAAWLCCASVVMAAVPRTPSPGMFPQRFSVSTGTTIPLNFGWDSISQSGEVHYDGPNQYLRMDHKSGSSEVSMIARFGEKQMFLLMDGKCVNVSVDGTLMPFTTPKGSILQEERTLIRDVIVVNYNGVMRGNEGRMHQLDFYVRQLNRSHPVDAGNWMPWRTVYSALSRRELASSSAPGYVPPEYDEEDNRDWIFYEEAHPDGDGTDNKKVAYYMHPNQALATVDPIQKVTTDYYNFRAQKPPEELFDPPEECEHSSAQRAAKFRFHAAGAYGHQLFEFQKTLSDLAGDSSHADSHHLLEDACRRYFCDASERETNRDAKPILDEEEKEVGGNSEEES
eukprot:TRINITY_DN7090_c0_g1_i1.p1 TRINITY_DN7090_c0_g1~~TRINITY_DN7090_c0_g1_i1.p1  ORF type:complete len:367 (+),score=129.55 TRINITY_DN7090_c0_g1_i1:75-1103(+)